MERRAGDDILLDEVVGHVVPGAANQGRERESEPSHVEMETTDRETEAEDEWKPETEEGTDIERKRETEMADSKTATQTNDTPSDSKVKREQFETESIANGTVTVPNEAATVIGASKRSVKDTGLDENGEDVEETEVKKKPKFETSGSETATENADSDVGVKTEAVLRNGDLNSETDDELNEVMALLRERNVSKSFLTEMKVILQAGGSVSAYDTEGRTALMCAAAIGDFRSVDKLLHQGADAHAKDHLGRTAAMFVCHIPLDWPVSCELVKTIWIQNRNRHHGYKLEPK